MAGNDINYAIRLLAGFYKTLNALLEFAEKHDLTRSEQKAYNSLAKMVKKCGKDENGEPNVYPIAIKNAALPDVQDAMKAAKIPFVPLADNSGNTFLFIRKSDKEKVKAICTGIAMSRGKGACCVSYNSLLSGAKIEGRDVYTAKGITREELYAFEKNARKQNVVYSAVYDTDTKKYNVSFANMNDGSSPGLEALKMAKLYAVGVSGKRFGMRVEKELQTESGVINAINNHSECFVVSGSNPKNYIHMDETGFKMYKDGVLCRSCSATDARFAQSAYDTMKSLSNPVIFNKNEFSFNEKDMKEQIDKKTAIPTCSAEERKFIKAELMARELMELKMSLDNGNQPENISALTNSECSWSEFFAHEEVNDGHDAEELKMHELADKIDKLSPDEQRAAREYVSQFNTSVSGIDIFQEDTSKVMESLDDKLDHADTRNFDKDNQAFDFER